MLRYQCIKIEAVISFGLQPVARWGRLIGLILLSMFSV